MTLASNTAVGEHFSFGDFELAPAARSLWRSGDPVKLSSRALDILIALASRPGEVLSQDELTQIVWRGAHIDETALRVGISALRKALGDEGERYVATVPGRGYCLFRRWRRRGPVPPPKPPLTGRRSKRNDCPLRSRVL
jgi:DNA-binding winged helix-turn-helix (wHTH) protein